MLVGGNPGTGMNFLPLPKKTTKTTVNNKLLLEPNCSRLQLCVKTQSLFKINKIVPSLTDEKLNQNLFKNNKI